MNAAAESPAPILANMWLPGLGAVAGSDWQPLTVENAYENAPIICIAHPEWGDKRLRRDGQFWTHWDARGSAILSTLEFRFWAVLPGHEGSRG